eukprot:TRINITY_DN105487_c0_g1_i3.p1 TRINITY_DN105487_c0_g1~~TRINITY_DN105487_c0_g1_i3.p1  ORF type:complete len:195 (+),score=14.82 TRINITY_DN105487_c0_g1_i3:75-659(+)
MFCFCYNLQVMELEGTQVCISRDSSSFNKNNQPLSFSQDPLPFFPDDDHNHEAAATVTASTAMGTYTPYHQLPDLRSLSVVEEHDDAAPKASLPEKKDDRELPRLAFQDASIRDEADIFVQHQLEGKPCDFELWLSQLLLPSLFFSTSSSQCSICGGGGSEKVYWFACCENRNLKSCTSCLHLPCTLRLSLIHI